MADWKKLVQSIIRDEKKVCFFDPATAEELESIKNTLCISAPEPLVELLTQTNGISGELYYLEYSVGSCGKIIEYTQRHEEWLRKNEITPPGKYIFFAEDGFGDYFGFAVKNGIISSEEIGAYCPIENEFRIVAHSLKEWAIGWYSGTLRF